METPTPSKPPGAGEIRMPPEMFKQIIQGKASGVAQSSTATKKKKKSKDKKTQAAAGGATTPTGNKSRQPSPEG